MGHVTASDGFDLYFEEAGAGIPVIFIHEYAGDHRSWEPQVRYFSRRYRCITYNARGYPPSDVPENPAAYGQDMARTDALAVLDHLDIDKAHIVGLSMGGFAALHFGFHHANRAHSLVVAGCGYGAEPDKRAQFKTEANATADGIERDTMAAYGKIYGSGPARVQYQNKDPRGFDEFMEQLCEHSTLGSANTMRGVQASRPSLYDLQDQMRELTVPTLIVNGDEDDPCLAPGMMMKSLIQSSAHVVLPRTGHATNLEEPALFNMFLDDFFHQVEAGKWALRDPRSLTSSILSDTP